MLVRRSSSIGRLTVHLSFKVKYCHKIFLEEKVELRCKEIFMETALQYNIEIQEIGFDKNHVHMVADIGILSIPQVAKLLKGRSAKVLLHEFPYLKEQYFWKSGLWSGTVFFDSVGGRTGNILAQNHVNRHEDVVIVNYHKIEFSMTFQNVGIVVLILVR